MVERGGLENRCGYCGHRGFESHPLRHIQARRGEMTEWSKVHDWKSCVGQPPTEGSNPSLSAIFILGWGSSSVGRALGSQSGGRGFDSHLLHQFRLTDCQYSTDCH